MQKSKLLASTMLVSAAALMATGGASAASLKLGGFTEFWTGFGDQNAAAERDTGTKNSFDVKLDSEIYFLAEETLDNGIKVGARLEMEAGNGSDNAGPAATGFDESFGWVKTKYGQVNLGANDVATGYVGGISSVGPVGVVKSDAGDWIPGAGGFLNNTDADLGISDAQNITYFTPKVAGVQVIGSYTPDSSDVAQGDYDDSAAAGLADGLSAAVRYSGKFGKTGVSLSAGMTHVRNDGGASRHSDGHAVRGSVKFGPAEVTGAYAKENLATRNDVHYGASVLFSISKMNKVSIGWGHGERQNLGAGVKDLESDLITVGYERNVGKGIKFAASAFWIEEEAAAGSDPSGVGVVGGFRLAF